MIFKKGSGSFDDSEPTTRRVDRGGDSPTRTGGGETPDSLYQRAPTLDDGEVEDWDKTQPNRWSMAEEDEPSTQPMSARDMQKVNQMDDFDDSEPKTKVVRPKRLAEDGGAAADPVTGWLVVIGGPGRGSALPLTYGVNGVGRARSERICLDFGDAQISREKHALVTYDPRGRRFYVQHGGGQNLTYLGDAPLLTPAELKGGEVISLGDTVLKFVPLCGPDFDWADE